MNSQILRNANEQLVNTSLPQEHMALEIPENDNDQPTSNPPLRKNTASEKQSISKKKKKKKKKKRHTFARVASTYWLVEVSWSIFLLGCLIAIAAVLHAFDGHVVPTWRYGITLNAIVSLLASVATFSLLIPVTAGLSQLKCNGPAGSIALLLRRRGGWLAYFGAFLTISLLAIGPFMQQIVKSGSRPITFSTASIPIADAYNPPPNQMEEMSMKAAIMNGILATNTSSDQFDVHSRCATGNCSWPGYQNLAVCSSCVDLTDSLTVKNTTDSPLFQLLELQNGVSLPFANHSTGVSMIVNSTQQAGTLMNGNVHYVPPIAFPIHTMALVDVFIILYAFGGSMVNGFTDEESVYAADCILEFCVQNYTAKEENAPFRESASGPAIVHNATGANTGFKYGQPWCFEPSNVNYTIGLSSLQNLMYYLATTLKGNESEVLIGDNQAEWQSEITQSIYIHWNETPHNLNAMFDNIARSMTQTLRMQLGTSKQHLGDSLILQIFVQIEWAWISLPFTLFTLAMVFLLFVALSTRKARLEPWKGSNIATLFHGLRHQSDIEFHRLLEQDSMDEVAKSVQVTLRMDEGSQFLAQE